MTRQIEAGDRGRTMGPMRPAGQICIDGEVFEARSEGTWVDGDTEVVVVGKGPFELIVRSASEDSLSPEASSRACEVCGAHTADEPPLHAPTVLVERINGVACGAMVGCLLIPLFCLAGEPLGVSALSTPLGGAAAGAIFQWCVRGAVDFAGPRADHRPLACVIAGIVAVGAAFGVFSGMEFGFWGLTGGLVLGTFLGGLFAWGGTVLTSW